MEHSLIIKHLGPIQECKMNLKQFSVLTGPQSNGKSTIAKTVYFFRSVKQDIMQIIMLGGPQAVTGRDNSRWERVLTQRLKEKFMQLFGTSWVMPQNMEVEYTYADNVWIRISLREGRHDNEVNYINIDYSTAIQDYLTDLDEHRFLDLTAAQKDHELNQLEQLFNDTFETVFVPAGRNLITLLSTQLNYIFTSLEGSQLRNIDFVTKRYTELILKLKPLFSKGMDGLWAEEKNTKKRSTGVNPAINQLLKDAKTVLQSKYRNVDGEERLYLDERRYIKINLASSGQQEVVWVFNLLFYYLLEDKKIFLILEEPESHLYPESQRIIGEVLALFANCGNEVLITTHSPYLLGTINYLLMAHQCPVSKEENIKAKIHKAKWIDPTCAAAYFIQKGYMTNILTNEDDLTLVQNEKIDGASGSINALSDLVLEQFWEESTDG